MASHQRTDRWIVWCVSGVVWSTIALVASTQQWAELRGGGKEMSWASAFIWQGSSWLLLIPASVLLLRAVHRWPIGRAHAERLWWHGCASVAFGALFLCVSVPARLAFHPSPARWSFFGEAFYKSIPQSFTIGILAYWAVVVVASLIETRARLHAVLETPSPGTESALRVLTLRSLAGMTRWPLREVVWVEPSGSGCRVHTDHGVYPVRHSISELDEKLGALGFARVHRGVIVNVSRVREVTGSAGRDGEVRLDDGTTLPVARRRRSALDAALSGLDGAPLASEAAPVAD